MGRFKKLRKKFTRFVSTLTEEQVREQLVLAYMQMERCNMVLKGKFPEPVEMLDNGEATDVELYYRCVKIAGDKKYLENRLNAQEEVRKEPCENEKLVTLGSEVYFMLGGRIHKGVIGGFHACSGDEWTCHVIGCMCPIAVSELFPSSEMLLEHLKDNVGEHISFSEHQYAAYFIDGRNRVLRGAVWYLAEKGIASFGTFDEMKDYLLRNIVEHGEED